MIFAGPPRVEAAHYVWCSSATKRRARLRRAMAPRADARRVTMLRSLTHVGEGTERRAPRRPSRCTAPEARCAQDGKLPYRAKPARLTKRGTVRDAGRGGRWAPSTTILYDRFTGESGILCTCSRRCSGGWMNTVFHKASNDLH